ncbi:hypothetical protein [Dyella sp. EPa41]|uniref:hypothetical protein n=1 Tax=Dyella sp. EPa41 TaxID=1561194 RepID=UPI001916494F|nr:hypothetical protein [Dyella sp. EPa41]
MDDQQLKWTRKLGNVVEKALPFVLTAAVICALLGLEWLTFDNGRSRYFFLFIAALSVAWGLLLTVEKVRRLNALPDTKRPAARARTRFRSEALAAMAIISFLGLFFRAGFDHDIANYPARLGYLNQAANELSRILPEDQCAKRPDSGTCNRVWSSLHGLQRAIGSAKESDVYQLMESANRALDETLQRSVSLDQETIRVVQGNLNDAVIDERRLSILFEALQLFAITFAVSAISRKLALAWIDHREMMAKTA